MNGQHPHTHPESRGFHSTDGLFFKRNEDGSVTIRAEDPPWEDGHGQLVKTVTLPADSWASAVASVCAQGENATTFGAAGDLHAGRVVG